MSPSVILSTCNFDPFPFQLAQCYDFQFLDSETKNSVNHGPFDFINASELSQRWLTNNNVNIFYSQIFLKLIVFQYNLNDSF